MVRMRAHARKDDAWAAGVRVPAHVRSVLPDRTDAVPRTGDSRPRPSVLSCWLFPCDAGLPGGKQDLPRRGT